MGRRLGDILVLLVITAGLVWMLSRGRKDFHELRVFSHDGKWVAMPSCIMPAPSGGPADFVSRPGWPIVEIPKELAKHGRELLATGPGCGFLRTEFRGQDRITLPPPIEVTISVAGQHPLPTEHGIGLMFHAAGVSSEVASLLDRAPAPSNYCDEPRRRWPQIWLDPESRSASVLLPCRGRWRVVWTLTLERPKPGEFLIFNVACAQGESLLDIRADGEQHALTIDPEDLEPDGWNLAGAESVPEGDLGQEAEGAH